MLTAAAALVALAAAHALGIAAATAPFYLYPPPAADYPASPLFAVAVEFLFAANGSVAAPAAASHVYYSDLAHRNAYPGARPGDAVQGQSQSWTGFAFDAGTYAARVTVTPTFAFEGCVLRPRSYGLTCEVAADGRSVSVTLPRSPAKVSVELLSQAVNNSAAFVAASLMLFPDPPEDPALVPAPGAPGVLYYGTGVHDVGGQLPLACNTSFVYLAPGAVVSGGFISTCAWASVTIAGRGTLLGTAFPWHAPGFEWALLNVNTGLANLVDGIVVADSPFYHVSSLGAGHVLRNVKMLGSWPYNSDGCDVPEGGLVEDCFIRANDDAIKLRSSGGLVQRTVVWQMVNGAVAQLGWWAKLDFSDATLRDVDVIHMDYCHTGLPGVCHGSDNDAVFNLEPSGTAAFSVANVTFQGVRIEGDAVRLLYLQAPAGAAGSVGGLAFQNVTADAVSLPQRAPANYVGSLSPGMAFAGLRFANITVGGACWHDAASAHLVTEGPVTSATFDC